jgi:hypothetical protein
LRAVEYYAGAWKNKSVSTSYKHSMSRILSSLLPHSFFHLPTHIGREAGRSPKGQELLPMTLSVHSRTGIDGADSSFSCSCRTAELACNPSWSEMTFKIDRTVLAISSRRFDILLGVGRGAAWMGRMA